MVSWWLESESSRGRPLYANAAVGHLSLAQGLEQRDPSINVLWLCLYFTLIWPPNDSLEVSGAALRDQSTELGQFIFIGLQQNEKKI